MQFAILPYGYSLMCYIESFYCGYYGYDVAVSYGKPFCAMREQVLGDVGAGCVPERLFVFCYFGCEYIVAVQLHIFVGVSAHKAEVEFLAFFEGFSRKFAHDAPLFAICHPPTEIVQAALVSVADAVAVAHFFEIFTECGKVAFPLADGERKRKCLVYKCRAVHCADVYCQSFAFLSVERAAYVRCSEKELACFEQQFAGVAFSYWLKPFKHLYYLYAVVGSVAYVAAVQLCGDCQQYCEYKNYVFHGGLYIFEIYHEDTNLFCNNAPLYYLRGEICCM